MIVTKEFKVCIAIATFLSVEAEKDSNKWHGLEAIAKEVGHSKHHCEQLVRKLRLAQVIESRKGPGGGHRYGWPLAKLTFGDIAMVLMGCENKRTLNMPDFRLPTDPIEQEFIEGLSKVQV